MACSMFADDLIIMGALTDREVTEFHDTLIQFSVLSGLKINQGKSKVWFSSNANPHTKTQLLNRFGVQQSTGDEKYLGCPVTVSGDNSFDYLVDQFERCLNQWKSKLLTHAGRLILLKSVLESLSVYAMGTVIVIS